MKRIICLFITIALVLSCLFSFSIITNAVNNDKSSRLTKVFEDQLVHMVDESIDNLKREIKAENYHIESTRKIADFSGNSYYLIECSPTGYMIFHPDSGHFIEYSPQIHSPFYEYKTNTIYYNGPNEYYIKNTKGQFYHIFDKEILNNENISQIKEGASSIDKQLKSNKNMIVLNYINGVSNETLASAYDKEKLNTPKSSEVNGWTYINQYSIIKNMSNCGYISGGKCGYIAAGILLTYKKAIGAYNCVTYNTHYTKTNNIYSIKTALPTALYNTGVSLGYGASTTSVAIHYTVNKWLSDRNITVNHTSLYAPLANNVVIITHIANDRPVIWFGYITGTGDHAVVLYGYKVTLGVYHYVAHFGWTGDSEVYFNGVVGSIYTFE